MKMSQSKFVNQAWKTALETNLDSEQTLVFSFFDRELPDIENHLAKIKEQFPKSVVMGCSSSGEIFKGEVNDKSISLAVVQFEKTKIKYAKENVLESSEAIGRSIANQLKTDDLKAVYLLSDGLNVNGTALIQGMNEILGAQVKISGGLAGDGSRFIQTDLCDQGVLGSKIVIAVGLYGDDIEVQCASRGGWDSFGVSRKITKSVNNVLFELDGKPALELYKEYLGDKASGLPGSALLFPLEIMLATGQKVVRTVLAVCEADQSMTFAGDIPQGMTCQLMQANFDRLVQGAEDAAEDLNVKSNLNPVFCLAVSCVGRRLVLGERIEDETEGVLDFLPKQSIQAGFYSYGELSPQGAGSCDLHNQTMTLTLISEK